MAECTNLQGLAEKFAIKSGKKNVEFISFLKGINLHKTILHIM
jgi:hypothetical protein